MLKTLNPEQAIAALKAVLTTHDEENKHLKGFWFKTLTRKILQKDNITYELHLEERRNANSWEKATKYFFCLYCKKIQNDKIEYLDIRYKNFGRDEPASFETMVNKFDNYKFPGILKIKRPKSTA